MVKAMKVYKDGVACGPDPLNKRRYSEPQESDRHLSDHTLFQNDIILEQLQHIPGAVLMVVELEGLNDCSECDRITPVRPATAQDVQEMILEYVQDSHLVMTTLMGILGKVKGV